MRQRFDIFGSLPDVIEDEWIEDIESLDAKLREFTERKKSANAFDLRYAAGATSDDQRWKLCERVLARTDVQKRLSVGRGERGESKQSEGKAPGEKRVSREMPLDGSAQGDLGEKSNLLILRVRRSAGRAPAPCIFNVIVADLTAALLPLDLIPRVRSDRQLTIADVASDVTQARPWGLLTVRRT